MYIIEDITKRDIDIMRNSGLKYNISQDPYDHTIKTLEFANEADMLKAEELINR